EKIGQGGGYDRGARARRIGDRLAALEKVTENDLLSIQLDDRAAFLDRWRAKVESILARPGKKDFADRRLQAVEQLKNWDGRAGVAAVGYRLVWSFRQKAVQQVMGWLTAPCLAADPRFAVRYLPAQEEPTWRLLDERPPHLLRADYADWNDFEDTMLNDVLAEMTPNGRPLAEATWGELNVSRVRHPIGRASPFLASWLDMPTAPLPGGWSDLPRIQGPDFGASQRMVVGPGREAAGVFHMPAGQSGHPLSPYYRSTHRAWQTGEPTSFVPGPCRHTLRLTPKN
ncbi:MAG: penicillin acylase family protein, partial [Planctomycetia bacterium]